MQPKLLSEIQGFKEAISSATASDSERRDFAYLGLPKTLCGVQVVLLTLRQFLRLLLLKNPFVAGGDVRAEDVAQFLWIVSPHYLEVYAPGLTIAQARTRKAQATRRRRGFIAGIVQIHLDDAIREIRAYLDEIFADTPSRTKSGIPITSFVAVFVEIFCAAFHWSRDAVLDSPLPLLYQELRRIILSANPKAAIVDVRTDKIKRLFLEKMDAETKGTQN